MKNTDKVMSVKNWEGSSDEFARAMKKLEEMQKELNQLRGELEEREQARKEGRIYKDWSMDSSDIL